MGVCPGERKASCLHIETKWTNGLGSKVILITDEIIAIDLEVNDGSHISRPGYWNITVETRRKQPIVVGISALQSVSIRHRYIRVSAHPEVLMSQVV